MKTNEVLNLIGEKDFIDKIYQFSYRRSNTSHEAEDLCSDIILAVISAVHNRDSIENFYAFVWTIARRVYADYSEKRNRTRQTVSIENGEPLPASKENEIDNFVEKTTEQEQLKKIFTEIAFLSKAYREVMVMYYIDELKVKDIAVKLGIRETTVKQRLFSARNTVRKEVESVNNRNLSLKPMKMEFWNTGKVTGNIPSPLANRTLSKNLIYLCKDKEKTVKELSEALCVPMIYIEEELEIQCHGQNGVYGTIRKTDSGKYISNILVAEYKEFEETVKICEKYIPQLCLQFKNNYLKHREEILEFPYLSEQKDEKFILWSLITRSAWELQKQISDEVKGFFKDVAATQRPYASVALTYSNETTPDFNVYGNDGIHANLVAGFNAVHMSNIYGKYIHRHFTCGHNISNDEKILLLLKSIGGLSVDSLTEDEKEIAAKAIEYGYLRKSGDKIEPKVVAIAQKDESSFEKLAIKLCEFDNSSIKNVAKELSGYIRNRIPKHLLEEYQTYLFLVTLVKIPTILIEGCIKEDLIYKPDNLLGGEGVLMIVEK